MRKLFCCMVFAVTAGVASNAAAGELTVTIANGRATVIAKDVTVRQILAEWARVGDTKIVNGEKVAGGPVTLQLVDMPERDALDILLRSAAGYMTAPRPEGLPGASLYDRVMILATSRAPANTVINTPQPYNRPALQQMPPQPPPPDEEPDEPAEQPQIVPNPGMPFPGPTPVPQGPNANPNAAPNQMPTTLPRPGILPQQPAQPGMNPYGPLGRPPGPAGRNGQSGNDQDDDR